MSDLVFIFLIFVIIRFIMYIAKESKESKYRSRWPYLMDTVDLLRKTNGKGLADKYLKMMKKAKKNEHMAAYLDKINLEAAPTDVQILHQLKKMERKQR